MPQQIGWSVEAKLLYEIKQLTKSLASRSYIQTFPNFASFPTPGITGTLYVDEATGDIYVWNGTSYVLLSSGITALNGLIAAAQLFATGSTGTDFNISSVGTTHTFNIPTASATNRGLLSSADWTTFNSKIGGTGTTNYVPKFTGAGTLGNSQIFDNGTNVGIGTASPTLKLQIESNINATDAIWMRNNNSGSSAISQITTVSNAGNIQINAYSTTHSVWANSGNIVSSSGLTGGMNLFVAANAPLSLWTNSAERLRITAAGDVGIGTTSPTQKLHVVGNSNVSGFGSFGRSVDGSYRLIVRGQGTTSATWGFSVEDSVSNMHFSVRDDGVTYMRGNVGIGTTSPTELLHIRGSSSVAATIHNTDFGSNATPAEARLVFRGGSAIVRSEIASQDRSQNVGGGWLYFRTGSTTDVLTDRMVITNAGNVGIGTTAPNFREQIMVATGGAATIVSAFTINSVSSGTGAAIAFSSEGGNTGTFKTGIGNIRTGGWDVSALVFYANNSQTQGNFTSSDERMRITSAGDVGIGTTNPAQKFVVSNAGSEGLEFTPALSANSNLIQSYNRVTSSYNTLVTRASIYNLQVGTTPALYIHNNGRVGINTTTDAGYQFDVNGSARINSSTFFQTNTTSNVFFDQVPSASNAAIIRQTRGSQIFWTGVGANSNDNWNLYDATNTAFRLTMTTSGNFGIGTTSPFVLLHVGAGGSGSLPDGAGASFNPQLVHSVTSGVAGIEAMVNDGTFNRRVGLFMDQTNSIAGISMSESSTSVPFVIRNSGGERLRIQAAGNVSIGSTLDLGDRLFVLGSIRNTTGFYVGNTTGYSGGVINESDTSRSVTITADPGNLAANSFIRFDVDGTTERMRINSSGNVGIGTTTPIGRLNIQNAGGPSVTPMLTLSQDGDLGLDWVSGVVNFYSNDSSTNSKGGIGHIRVSTETAYNTGQTPSYMSFYTHPNVANNNTDLGNVVERMRITSAGDVGIGTTNPALKLHVEGGMRVRNASGHILEFINDILYIYGGSGNYYQYINGANYVFENRTATGALTFGTNNTERLRITSGGNVLIGTTTDTGEKFQVAGTARVTQDCYFATFSGNVAIANTSPTYRLDISGTLRNTTDAYFATTSGNVGIGTTTPATVAGYTIVAINNATNGGMLDYMRAGSLVGRMYADNSEMNVGTTVASFLRFTTNSAERMRITASGEVAIGATTGTAPLLVFNSVANTNVIEVRGGGGSSQSRLAFTYGTASAATATNGLILASLSAFQFAAGSNIPITFDTNPGVQAERMRITATGDVGIGTSTPGSRLQIGSGNFSLSTLSAATVTGSTPATGTQKITLGGNGSNGVGNEIGWYPNSSFAGDIAQITAIATAFGSSTAGALVFRTNTASETTPSEKMRITSGGDVGIGTTVPTFGAGTGLEIERDSATATLRLQRATGNPSNLELRAAADIGELIVTSNTPLALGTGNTERMRITFGGNVLIGTTTDNGNKLQVVGNGALFGDGTNTFSLLLNTSRPWKFEPTGTGPGTDMRFIDTTGGKNFTIIDGTTSNISARFNNGGVALCESNVGNLLIGSASVGTGSAVVIGHRTGTAPSTSPVDCYQLYSADITAGNAAPHFRTENGAVVKLYQETTAVANPTFTQNAGAAVNDASTFDGYTLAQVVRALKNQGLLA